MLQLLGQLDGFFFLTNKYSEGFPEGVVAYLLKIAKLKCLFIVVTSVVIFQTIILQEVDVLYALCLHFWQIVTYYSHENTITERAERRFG